MRGQSLLFWSLSCARYLLFSCQLHVLFPLKRYGFKQPTVDLDIRKNTIISAYKIIPRETWCMLYNQKRTIELASGLGPRTLKVALESLPRSYTCKTVPLFCGNKLFLRHDNVTESRSQKDITKFSLNLNIANSAW